MLSLSNALTNWPLKEAVVILNENLQTPGHNKLNPDVVNHITEYVNEQLTYLNGSLCVYILSWTLFASIVCHPATGVCLDIAAVASFIEEV